LYNPDKRFVDFFEKKLFAFFYCMLKLSSDQRFTTGIYLWVYI